MSVIDTIFALATPPLPSAIAVLRISGSHAFVAANKLCGSLPQERGRGLRSITVSQKIVDQALVLLFEAPHSATGEDVVEFHLHGNPKIVEAVEGVLRDQGLRRALAGEFTRRAVENGVISLSQAEAVDALVKAASVESAVAAAQVLAQGLALPVANLEVQLIHLIAMVEAQVDFAEEDIDPDGTPELRQGLERLQHELEDILSHWQRSAPWRRGLRIVLAGAPNSGKSTLLNRLLGQERALVSSEAGTTRDYIEAGHSIGNLPVALIDTAGLRTDAGGVEQAGIILAREQIASADLVLWLHRPEERQPGALMPEDSQKDTPEAPVLHVWNFCDDPGYGQWVAGENAVIVSAKTGVGVDRLEQMIAERFALATPPVMPLVSQRQADAVQECVAALDKAGKLLDNGGLPELLAEELYAARQALAALLGNYDRDRTLDLVFSNFCIGK